VQRFEQIYAGHAEAVRAYVRRRAPEVLVDDVVADVFVVALRRIDDVPRNALPWLYAVARKTLANERRKRRDLPIEREIAYEPEPVGDRLSAGDAARVLECSPVAARVRYHRAKVRLAARLDGAASFRPRPRGATR
jgi:DNA-directed RNA polymerase specialized sigma24 family protein